MRDRYKRRVTTMSFADVVDAASNLSLDEQESLMEILRQRMIEKGRERILADIEASRRDYREGRARIGTPEEIVKELFS
jgi:hypothetical protein